MPPPFGVTGHTNSTVSFNSLSAEPRLFRRSDFIVAPFNFFNFDLNQFGSIAEAAPQFLNGGVTIYR